MTSIFKGVAEEGPVRAGLRDPWSLIDSIGPAVAGASPDDTVSVRVEGRALIGG